jgi:hypothetical protein
MLQRLLEGSQSGLDIQSNGVPFSERAVYIYMYIYIYIYLVHMAQIGSVAHTSFSLMCIGSYWLGDEVVGA